jgi:hypothetical protein
MRITTRVALAACVALGALTPASANHSWGSYHWARTTNPVKLRINKALTGSWVNYANIAIGEWDASSKLDLTTYASTNLAVNRRKCNPIPNQVLVCNDTYGQRGTNYGWGIGTCVLKNPHEGVAEVLSAGSFGHGGAWGTQAWVDPVKGVAYVLMVQRANFPNSDASDVRRAFQKSAADALAKESH